MTIYFISTHLVQRVYLKQQSLHTHGKKPQHVETLKTNFKHKLCVRFLLDFRREDKDFLTCKNVYSAEVLSIYITSQNLDLFCVYKSYDLQSPEIVYRLNFSKTTASSLQLAHYNSITHRNPSLPFLIIIHINQPL